MEEENEVAWQNLFSGLEIEDGDFFNHAHHHLQHNNNSFDDEEMILREFGFSSMPSSSSPDTAAAAAIPNENVKSNNHNCSSQSSKRKQRKSPESTTYHNMVERKRRLELSQKLRQISDIIPGFNKTDHGSILKEAVGYVKQLQTRISELEEECAMKEGISPYKINSNDYCNKLPEVEATLMEKEILIRIHCKKNDSIVLKTLSHIRNLHFTIASHSVLPFGKFSLAVTINAKVGEKCKIEVKDLVKSLKRALLDSPDKQLTVIHVRTQNQ